MKQSTTKITPEYLVQLSRLLISLTGDLANISTKCECIQDPDKTKLILLQQQLLDCSGVLLNASRCIKNAPQCTKGV